MELTFLPGQSVARVAQAEGVNSHQVFHLTCFISPTASSGQATCSLSPASVNLNGTTAQTSTLTIGTTAATANLVYPKLGNHKGWLGAGSGAVLALLVFFCIPARRRSWRAMLSILVAMIALGALASCGGVGGYPSEQRTLLLRRV